MPEFLICRNKDGWLAEEGPIEGPTGGQVVTVTKATFNLLLGPVINVAEYPHTYPLRFFTPVRKERINVFKEMLK